MQPGAVSTLLISVSPPAGDVAVKGLPAWFVVVFLVLFGFVISLPSLYYAVRIRNNPLSYLKGILGGSIGTTVFAALGTEVGGLTNAHLSWLEAAILSGTGFFLGCLFWGLAGFVYAKWVIVQPLKDRYGPGYGTRIELSLLSGLEPVSKLLRDVSARWDADKVWDEFAVSAITVLEGLDTYRLPIQKSGLELLEYGFTKDVPETEVYRYIEDLLQPHLEKFSSKLSRTYINFTFWRVVPDNCHLEHMLSFPAKPTAAHKRPLPIWKGEPPTCGDFATLAAASLGRNSYQFMNTASYRGRGSSGDDSVADGCSGFELRGLGTKYDAVGCMPVPFIRNNSSPWAVLCIESRDGVIPLNSELVVLLLRRLVDLVQPAEPLLSLGDFQTALEARVGAKNLKSTKASGQKAGVREEQPITGDLSERHQAQCAGNGPEGLSDDKD